MRNPSFTSNYRTDRKLRAIRLSRVLSYEIMLNGNIIVGMRVNRRWTTVYAFWNALKGIGKVVLLSEFTEYGFAPGGYSQYKTFAGWLRGVKTNLGVDVL